MMRQYVTELHLQDAFPKDAKADIAVTVKMINDQRKLREEQGTVKGLFAA